MEKGKCNTVTDANTGQGSGAVDGVLPSWERDGEAICIALAGTKTPMKIVLKTRNDPWLLETWIRHHARIVGYSGLIIADNRSTDQRVLDLYRRYQNRMTIFSFSGFHNRVHDRRLFAPLYKAFGSSCTYTLVIDTDEFLIRIDHGRWAVGGHLPDIITQTCPDKALCIPWIYNHPFSKNLIEIGSDPSVLIKNAQWGKPIVPASYSDDGMRIHNAQFPPDLFAEDYTHGFFLVHYTRFSKEQRMEANRQKLIARNRIDEQTTFEEIAAIDLETVKDVTNAMCIREIRNLIDQPDNLTARRHLRPRPGTAKLTLDGRVRFHSLFEREALRKYLDCAPDLVPQRLRQNYAKWQPKTGSDSPFAKKGQN